MDFEHTGYMTECVQAMCDWVLKQPVVSYIIAETDIGHSASENVLKRCGFQFCKRTETNWWQL